MVRFCTYNSPWELNTRMYVLRCGNPCVRIWRRGAAPTTLFCSSTMATISSAGLIMYPSEQCLKTMEVLTVVMPQRFGYDARHNTDRQYPCCVQRNCSRYTSKRIC